MLVWGNLEFNPIVLTLVTESLLTYLHNLSKSQILQHQGLCCHHQIAHLTLSPPVNGTLTVVQCVIDTREQWVSGNILICTNGEMLSLYRYLLCRLCSRQYIHF